MYTYIKFNRAAFRHKATKADILRAFETFIYEDPIEGADNKYLLIGFNLVGNPIEVMYNKIDDDSINIFHAMPCRREFYSLI
jgi:hypothetical protein